MIFVWTEHGVPLNRPIVTKIKIYCRAVGLHHYYWLWEKSAVKIFSSWLWSRQSPPCLIQYNVTLASALFHSIIISMSLLFILLPEAHRKNISNTKYLDYFALHIKIKKEKKQDVQDFILSLLSYRDNLQHIEVNVQTQTGMSSKAALADSLLFLWESRYCHMTVENAAIM